MDRMLEIGEDSSKVKGKLCFHIILSVVTKLYDNYDAISRNVITNLSAKTSNTPERYLEGWVSEHGELERDAILKGDWIDDPEFDLGSKLSQI